MHIGLLTRDVRDFGEGLPVILDRATTHRGTSQLSGTRADVADMSAEGVDAVVGDGSRPDLGLNRLIDGYSAVPDSDLVDPVLASPFQETGLPKLSLKSERDIVADPSPGVLPSSLVTPRTTSSDDGELESTSVPDVLAMELEPGITNLSQIRRDTEADATYITLSVSTTDATAEDADDSQAEAVPDTTFEIGQSPRVDEADHLRGVVDLDYDDGEAKPANWFLAANAFGVHAIGDDGVSTLTKSRSRQKSQLVKAPEPGGSTRGGAGSGRKSGSFTVFAVVLLVLIGGFVKVGVLDPGNRSVTPSELALRPTSLACRNHAPVRSALRYERHDEVEEVRRASNLVETTRTRFVDNESKNFIDRRNGSASETEILVSGRHFVATQPDVWSEAPLADEEIAAAFALPFGDRFTEATWLNDTAVSGVATCVYSALLGRVTLPNGERISNSQLELYVDSSGQYRRVRVRGARLAGTPAGSTSPDVIDSPALREGTGDSAGTGEPGTDDATVASDGVAIETYVLTIDIESAPPFVPNVPNITGSTPSVA